MQVKVSAWLLVMLVMGVPAPAQSSAGCTPQDPPRVVSGGVGASELQALREVEPGHNLKLVFTLHSGQYVAGVDVEISGTTSGQVLRHRARGPWLLACLPAGRYVVAAEYEAQRQSRLITLGRSPRIEYFRWMAAADDGVSEPGTRDR
jgi:hypothetical protein